MVLVAPKGPLNVGSIARLCANFDVNELRIVSPKCDIFSLEAVSYISVDSKNSIIEKKKWWNLHQEMSKYKNLDINVSAQELYPWIIS